MRKERKQSAREGREGREKRKEESKRDEENAPHLEGEAGGGVRAHGGDGGAELGGEGARHRGLHLDLDHLHGAQGDVGEDLGRGGAGEPDDASVLGGGLLASQVGVVVLEELVQAELEAALGRVADERGQPALEERAAALLLHDGADGAAQALVLDGVHLHVALGHIQGRHSQVGKAARQHAAHAALEVVVRRVRVLTGEAGVPLLGRRRQDAALWTWRESKVGDGKG